MPESLANDTEFWECDKSAGYVPPGAAPGHNPESRHSLPEIHRSPTLSSCDTRPNDRYTCRNENNQATSLV